MKLETQDFFQTKLGKAMPPIGVLDVGVSGGIDGRWRTFGDKLYAMGIDPLLAEIGRLKQEEKNPQVEYRAAYVAWKQWEKKYPTSERRKRDNGSFERTTAYAAVNNYADTYVRENYNSNHEVAFSEERLELDELWGVMPGGRVDFLKTDTDGFDLPALRSGEKLLSSDQVLGVAVECNFHGDDHPYANNFSNIDAYLRSKGFTLFDLTPYRYSRSAMPERFCYSITAQTEKGAMQWADGLYFRDFCHPRFSERTGWKPDTHHLIKQAMLLEMFAQYDSAVELLVKFADQLEISEDLLERMFARYGDKTLAASYRGLIENFQRDHTHFFPQSTGN